MRSFVTAIAFTVLVLIMRGSGTHARGQQAESPADQGDMSYYPPPASKSVEIGNFYLKRKNLRGALGRFKEAVKTDPYYAPAYLGLGKVYEKMGLKQKALDAYQKYLDELPSTKDALEAKDVHNAIARLRKELGSGAKATHKAPPPQ